MKISKNNLLLLGIAIILCLVPFITAPDGEYGGADGAAEEEILKIDPDYEPWFEPVFEPNSGEIESMLFTLQGTLGGIFIGYFFGKSRGKRGLNHD